MADDCIIAGQPATGTFTQTGLTRAGLITEVVVSDSVWTPLPATALIARNQIDVQNQSAIEVKVNFDPTVVGYVGMKVRAGGERQYAITDQIVLYAKAAPASGGTTLTVEELS